MQQKELDLFIKEGVNYNFCNDKDYKKALDIVTVMSSIFDADIKATGDVKKSRVIKIKIPVHNATKWILVKEKLENLVNWVSSDLFSITFVERNNYNFYRSNTIEMFPEVKKDCITLFSGGLDSFSGAYYNYKNGISSSYIGYINKKEEGSKQKEMRTFYKKMFPNDTIELHSKYDIKKSHYVQSTRSLLYLSLAISKAISLKTNEVRMYENGVLSLNPELGGRFTTKTTHPKTIYLYNQILEIMDYEIKIKNIFEFSTKGKIINNMSKDFKEKIRNTYTCGKGRSQGKKVSHSGQCGVCIPCLLRKISLAAYENEAYDSSYFIDYNVESILKDDALFEYKHDYLANIGYFKEYVKLINNGEIQNYLNGNRALYHDNPDYISLQNKMFESFSKEFERYEKKYGVS